jgi:integrase
MGLPKGIQAVRKRAADGTERVYYYVRGTGIRLPDDPASPDFLAAYTKAVKGDGFREGTWGALVEEFKRSQTYRALDRDSQKYHDRALERVRDWSAYPLESIKRRNILAVRDGLAQQFPQSANQFVIVLSSVFRFAVDREYREFNPCSRIPRIKGGEWQPWSDEQIAFALARKPATPPEGEPARKYLPEPYRRAVVLALYTGQREGDCCAMRWDDYDGEGVAVVQEKTGTPLWVPCHRALRNELDQWDRRAETMLTTERGTSWNPRSFSTMISRMLRAHPILAGCVFHGLRKTASNKLAEAGCSDREIMAITGHKTAAMVDLYTRGASQKRRARSAMVKLEGDGV